MSDTGFAYPDTPFDTGDDQLNLGIGQTSLTQTPTYAQPSYTSLNINSGPNSLTQPVTYADPGANLNLPSPSPPSPPYNYNSLGAVLVGGGAGTLIAAELGLPTPALSIPGAMVGEATYQAVSGFGGFTTPNLSFDPSGFGMLQSLN